MIGELVEGWQQFKIALVPQNEQLRDLVHVHFGIALWVAAALVFRQRLQSRRPLLAVWLVTLLTEGADVYAMWPMQYAWMWHDTGSDLINTLIWPSILWAVLNIQGRFSDRQDAKEQAGENDEAEGA